MFYNYGNLGIQLIGAEKWKNLSLSSDDEFNTLSIRVIDGVQIDKIDKLDAIFVLLDNVGSLKNISYNDIPILVFQDDATLKSFIEIIKSMWAMGNTQILNCHWIDIATLFRSNEKNIKVISQYQDIPKNKFSDILIFLMNYDIQYCNDSLYSFSKDTNCIFSLVTTENTSFKDKKYFACNT